MKQIMKISLVIAIGGFLFSIFGCSTHTHSAFGTGEAGETIETRIGELSFTHDFANGYPTAETQHVSAAA